MTTITCIAATASLSMQNHRQSRSTVTTKNLILGKEPRQAMIDYARETLQGFHADYISELSGLLLRRRAQGVVWETEIAQAELEQRSSFKGFLRLAKVSCCDCTDVAKIQRRAIRQIELIASNLKRELVRCGDAK